MTRDSKVLEERGPYWQRRLNLDHWKIKFRWADPEELELDVSGTARVSETYDRATITVAYDLEKRLASWICPDPAGYNAIDYILVHELLHVVTRNADGVMQSLLVTLGYTSSEGHRSRWSFEEENLVDRLTHIVLDLEKGDTIACQ